MILTRTRLVYRNVPVSSLCLHRLRFNSSSSRANVNTDEASKKPAKPSTWKDKLGDAKLRDIIESSNLGSAAQLRQKIQDEAKHKYEQALELKSQISKKLQQIVPEDAKSKSKPTSLEDEKDPLDGSLPGSLTPNDISKKINAEIHMENKGLPSEIERRRSHLVKRFEAYLESLQETIFSATRTLNDVTGYSSIEKLKFSIDKLELDLKTAKEDVKQCKTQYTEMISERSNSQREVNDLLTRKHNWTPQDLERFTQLYRNDHANEQREIKTEENLAEAESRVDSIQIKLTQSILTRYHEEQIWSDKIRRASTWGTWVLMGINIGLFIIATFLVEPWKRKRLVGSFEDKVKQVLIDISQGDGRQILLPALEAIDAKEGGISEGIPVGLDVGAGQVVETTDSDGLERLGDAKESKEIVVQELNGVEVVQEVKSNDLKNSPDELASALLEQANNHRRISFNILFKSWSDAKSLLSSSFQGLSSKDIEVIEVDKFELGLLASVVTLLGCAAGSLVTLYFTK